MQKRSECAFSEVTLIVSLPREHPRMIRGPSRRQHAHVTVVNLWAWKPSVLLAPPISCTGGYTCSGETRFADTPFERAETWKRATQGRVTHLDRILRTPSWHGSRLTVREDEALYLSPGWPPTSCGDACNGGEGYREVSREVKQLSVSRVVWSLWPDTLSSIGGGVPN